MTVSEELVSMDLRSFAAWYRSESKTATLSHSEGRVLVEFFVRRLLDEADFIDSDEWEGFADTLDKAMALAGLDSEERAIRRLNLTLALVNRVGPSSEHSLRNPDAAADIFLDALPMDFAEASTRVVDWPRASLDIMDRLSTIKILLLPVVGFKDQISDGAAKESIEEWMTLLPVLP